VALAWPAVRAGALAEVAVIAPVVGIYTVVHATGAVTGDAATVVTAVIAAIVAPLVGGVIAGRRGRARPLTNGAVATAIGIGVYVAFRGVDAIVRGQSLSVGAVVILVMLSVLLGVAGGWIGARVKDSAAQ
jgi:hypothetical protein